MKNKHHGFACLIISGLSLVIMLGYGAYLANTITGSIQVPGPAFVADIKVPDDGTLAYMNYLIPHLKELGRPAKKDSTVDLGLFMFPPEPFFEKTDTPGSANSLETGTTPEENIVFPYTLTLSFTSLKKNICVIDGKLYETGGLLPDGGKILKIENDRVFIQKKNKKEWLYPLQKRGLPSEKSEETI